MFTKKITSSLKSLEQHTPMRIVFAVLLLSVTLSLSGATYYVANKGNDCNPGTMTKPWATISKVNRTSFSAGDFVLFKRGDLFRGQLEIPTSGNAVGGYITFGAYGTSADPKPKIWSSVDASATTFWTPMGNNIWRTTSVLNTCLHDCGNVIFNNEASCGWKKTKQATCTAQGDWYINPSTDYLYLYSVSNPGSFYTHIEIGGIYNEDTVSTFKSYIIIQDLDVRYSANNGIRVHSANNVIIQRNDVSWIGGMYFNATTTRMGNGIQLWETGNNMDVRYNKIKQCYDAGISPQGNSAYTCNGIFVHHNLISLCYYGIEFWTSVGSQISNVSFDNNTIVDCGWQWSQAQRPNNSAARSLMFWDLSEPVTGTFSIRNNIFSNSRYYAFRCDSGYKGLNIDYNIWDVDVIARTSGTTYITLAQWQAGELQDLHSKTGDPLFTSSTNFHLLTGSPAIKAGANLGYTLDLDGIPITDTPEIGAYQYGGTTTTAERHNRVTNGSDSNPGTITQP